MFNFQRMEKETDNESGQPGALYPGMMESVDLRWAFIRKIYTILTVQLALTAAVAAVVVTVKPIPHFFVSSNGGLALYIVLLLLPFLIMCPLYYYHQKHPINFVLLGFFTVSMSFAVGMSCAFTSGSDVVSGCAKLNLSTIFFWQFLRRFRCRWWLREPPPSFFKGAI